MLSLPPEAPELRRAVLGRPAPSRQLEFALASGCRKVVLLGDGGSPEAIALTREAQEAGARVVPVASPHALAGAVGRDAMLLVLQPGLVPDNGGAMDELGAGEGILVLPAGAGVQAGFERIDLDRAWAGALAIRGELLEKLLGLPEDSDANAALLRIALQARLPESRLAADVLADGSWTLLSRHTDMVAVEDRWIERHLPEPGAYALSARLARIVLRDTAQRLLEQAAIVSALGAMAVALQALGVGLAALGLSVTALLMVAVAAPVSEAAIGLHLLRASPLAHPRMPPLSLLRWTNDAAFLLVGVLTLTGTPAARAFPPVVLLLALLAARANTQHRPGGLLTDRGVLCLGLALASAFLGPDLAFMVAGLLVLVLNAVLSLDQRG